MLEDISLNELSVTLGVDWIDLVIGRSEVVEGVLETSLMTEILNAVFTPLSRALITLLILGH